MKRTRGVLICIAICLTGCGGDPSETSPDPVEPSPVTPWWRAIEAGSFNMGSPVTERCRSAAAELPHPVTITRSFEMAPTEVTQHQFDTVMGYNPSQDVECGANCPVETVSWHEAAAYCNALSAQAGLVACYQCSGDGAAVSCRSVESYAAYTGGKLNACPGYRLPTDAEWEYAYRAGTTTALYSGLDVVSCEDRDEAVEKLGWYDQNASETPHDAGDKQPNGWGLHDMAGNVWEWVNDRFVQDLGPATLSDPEGPSTSDERGVRGGSWLSYAKDLRAASRRGLDPASRGSTIGFRCVRSLP